MIKIEKGPEPAILSTNSRAWTDTLMNKLARLEEPTLNERSRYRHREIKAALVAETYGKCAYCESKLRHTAYGDVEHIVPKSKEPNRSFEWQNLTLACDVCNTNKSDFLGNHDTFIDPYSTNPEEHFWHLGETIHARPGCDAALSTERVLKLNRAELVERRREKLKALLNQLSAISKVKDAALKKILLNDFVSETTSDKEYAALAREIARRASLIP